MNYTSSQRAGLRSVYRAPITLPAEFRELPLLVPPDMTDPHNPDGDWYFMSDWRSPIVKDGKGNSVQIVVRPAIKRPDGHLMGCHTDGVSIPSAAGLIMQQSHWGMPELCFGLPHDLAYMAELADRATCDNWLFDFAAMAGVNWVQRQLDYVAVHQFGGYKWDAHKQKDVALFRQFTQLVPAGAPAVWPEIGV